MAKTTKATKKHYGKTAKYARKIIENMQKFSHI